MSKIGLIDVDGHNFPNLALMKISAYHKNMGDTVEFVNYFDFYDKVYMSKVFTFTPDINTSIQSNDIVRGGTGYDINVILPKEIEEIQPDYSLYPISKWYDQKTSYGFITRGCIRNCSWCLVRKKEGELRTVSDIEIISNGNKRIVLMDNNILASKDCINTLKKIIELGYRVDFNQGLDARLVTEEIAYFLSKIKWIEYIRFSYDTKEQLDPLLRAIEKLNLYGVKNSKIFIYCLIQDFEDSLNRINSCKKLGIKPFAQPYRDFTPNQIIPQWQKDMARWCNDKALINSFDFKDYKPRVGFKCESYFYNNK